MKFPHPLSVLRASALNNLNKQFPMCFYVSYCGSFLSALCNEISTSTSRSLRLSVEHIIKQVLR